MDFIDNMKHIVKGQRKRRETLATLPGLSRKKADIIEELDEGDEDNIAEGIVSLVSMRIVTLDKFLKKCVMYSVDHNEVLNHMYHTKHGSSMPG